MPMSRLPIVMAPDRVLKTKCAPVTDVDGAVRRLMDDMLETMYDAPGLGLAAPQVGVTRRVFVVDVAREGEPPAPMAFANPEIVAVSDERIVMNEGCLSLPEIYVDVERPEAITVAYLDRDGEERRIDADGMLARCMLHEIDHLDGILHVDYLSTLRRSIILRKLAKQRKGAA